MNTPPWRGSKYSNPADLTKTTCCWNFLLPWMWNVRGTCLPDEIFASRWLPCTRPAPVKKSSGLRNALLPLDGN